MKKVIFTLAIAGMFAFAACNNEKKEEPKDQPQTEQTENKDEQKAEEAQNTDEQTAEPEQAENAEQTEQAPEAK